MSTLLRLFAPYVPFVTEEVWSWWQPGSIHRAPWPTADEVVEPIGGVDSQCVQVFEQTQLALELLDDFKAGEFRDVPWHSVAILSGAVLYLVSPLDVIPYKLPGLGHLDEVALLSVAVRLAQKDLRRYCEFKRRPAADYF